MHDPAEPAYDAIVIGSGPNGLAAAVTLAEHAWKVLVLEAADAIGGGTRTRELTLPGFRHDVCAAIHPMAIASPFLRTRPLESHGLSWCWPEVQLAHPLDDGTAVALYRDLDRTVRELGEEGPRYQSLVQPLVRQARELLDSVLAPWAIPRHPLLLARFGLLAARSAEALARQRLSGPRTRALFAGAAGHAVLPLDQPFSAAVGLVLCVVAHAVGWPAARGGSAAITGALAGYLESMGGQVETNRRVQRLGELPAARVVLFDLAPGAVAKIAAPALPEAYRSRLLQYRHGPAAFKVDWALAGPIPWAAAEARQAGTVHVGGSLEEVAAAEQAPWQGQVHARPFVIVAQQSLFDSTRAPAGQHTGWAYCHVPNGDGTDQLEAIEAQIERFAPGFRALILGRSVMRPADFQAYNANFVGGDVVGGAQDWTQLLARPVLRLNPYTTPNPRLYLCSASTPPGGGVHGMGGYLAAQAALRRAARLERVQW
jgi:phytoene dehydrogenase-like protein